MEIARLEDKKRLLCYFNSLQRFYDQLADHVKFLGYHVEGVYYHVKDVIQDVLEGQNKDIEKSSIDALIQRIIDILEYYTEKIENIARKYRVARGETKPTGCD